MSDLNKLFSELGTSAEKEEKAALRAQYELLSIKTLEKITTDTTSSDDAINVAFQLIDEKKAQQMSPERIKYYRERLANDPDILTRKNYIIQHPEEYDSALVEACKQLK